MNEADEIKMLADIRFLHSGVLSLHNGVEHLRVLYRDEDLIKHANMTTITADAERLRRIYVWLFSLREEMIKKGGTA